MTDGSITAAAKLKAVERELTYRRRVYPRLVGDGRMKQDAMDQQIRVFEAIADDYRTIAEREAAASRLL